MTIDRTKLVDLLIEKTRLSPDEVEIQLDQLIERILDAAERGKALEIKEFGLFFFDQEGNLKFEPSEELSTEISFKYAGMKPVELKPERNTTIPDDDDLPRPIKIVNDVIVVPVSGQKSASVKAKPKSKPKPKEKTAEKPAPRRPVRKKRDHSTVWALLAFFTVLFIGALIYFSRPMGPASEDSVAQSEPALQGSGIIDSPELVPAIEPDYGSNESSAEMPAEEFNNEERFEEQITDARVSVQDQMYGLTGNLSVEATVVYSIVIHSFYNELRADEVAQNYRADGYRVHVTERVLNGLEVWRVSLGQFKSIQDAQEIAKTLPEPFNENNFIQRIQQQ